MAVKRSCETTEQRAREPEAGIPVHPGDDELGLTELLRRSLDRPAKPDKPESWKHRLIGVLLHKAGDGDLKAIQEIWTRLEGKAGLTTSAEPEIPEISEDLALRILRAAGEDEEDDVVHGHDDDAAEILAEDAER